MLVWVPEAGGPVDLNVPTHRVLIQVLAAQSQREVVRSRHRTVAAMTAQTIEQGRFLGGRPPYGYRLVDAGPHWNQAHAAWGRRCHRLAPDSVTAPHVRWMFAERRAGRSMAGIARELNERGVPCPSAADPDRNRHRSRQGWNLRSVAVILANPRYTGRQVWSRQRSLPGTGRSTVAGEWAVPGPYPIRRWSAKPTSSRCSSVAPSGGVRTARRATTCSPGWCSAGCAVGAWTRIGSTVALDTAAVMVTTVPGPDRRTRRATSTSARTCSWTGSPSISRPIGTDPATTSS